MTVSLFSRCVKLSSLSHPLPPSLPPPSLPYSGFLFTTSEYLIHAAEETIRIGPHAFRFLLTVLSAAASADTQALFSHVPIQYHLGLSGRPRFLPPSLSPYLLVTRQRSGLLPFLPSLPPSLPPYPRRRSPLLARPHSIFLGILGRQKWPPSPPPSLLPPLLSSLPPFPRPDKKKHHFNLSLPPSLPPSFPFRGQEGDPRGLCPPP